MPSFRFFTIYDMIIKSSRVPLKDLLIHWIRSNFGCLSFIKKEIESQKSGHKINKLSQLSKHSTFTNQMCDLNVELDSVFGETTWNTLLLWMKHLSTAQRVHSSPKCWVLTKNSLLSHFSLRSFIFSFFDLIFFSSVPVETKSKW